MKRSVRTALAAVALAGAGFLAVGPTAEAAFAYPVQGGITVTITTNPDGSKTITIIITNLKGVKTVKIFIVPGVLTQSAMRSALLAAPAAHPASVPTLTAAAPAGAVFLGTGTVSAAGVLNTSVKVPTSITGKATVYVEGTNAQGQLVSATSVITLTGAGGVSGLPFTGSNNVVPYTLAGAGALALGSGMIVVARRRRSSAVPA